MKVILKILFIVRCCCELYAQNYSGELIDKLSRMPIPYANIGILNRDVGTVSDIKGVFRLELNDKYENDTIYISCIGYEKKSYLIADFRKEARTTGKILIELVPRIYQLDEVVIKPVNLKTYTLGNYCDSNSCYGNTFHSQKLGNELGIKINLPENTVRGLIKNLRFYVGEFTFNKFTLRLNVYDIKNGLPSENILNEQIFIEISSPGEYVIELKQYNIRVSDEFFISLEYYKIPEGTEGKLIF